MDGLSGIVIFFQGKRCPDDKRQIARWNGITGPNGRFRKWLVTLIIKNKQVNIMIIQ